MRSERITTKNGRLDIAGLGHSDKVQPGFPCCLRCLSIDGAMFFQLAIAAKTFAFPQFYKIVALNRVRLPDQQNELFQSNLQESIEIFAQKECVQRKCIAE